MPQTLSDRGVGVIVTVALSALVVTLLAPLSGCITDPLQPVAAR